MAAAGVAVVVAVAFLASSSSGGGSGIAKPAAFDLPAISGAGRIRLADFRGKPTVVNFFASWCTACDSELPAFSAVSAKLRGQVNFVGVDALETGDRMFMPRRHDITWWPLARDVGGANGSGLHDSLCQCDSMPVTALYDASGRLLNVDREALVGNALSAELQKYYGVLA
jgi:cytochrome c biogenesis protein CcmG/thiol:disulfide interchange protein DsbE